MVVWVHKEDTDLDVGESEHDHYGGSWVFDTDRIIARFHRVDGSGNMSYWRYPLGNLDETNNFYARFKLIMPDRVKGTNSASAFLGFKKASDVYSGINAIQCYMSASAEENGGPIGYDGAGAVYITTNNIFTHNATCYMAIDWSSTRKTVRVRMYDSDGVIEGTWYSPDMTGKTFDVDTVGMNGYSKAGSNVGAFNPVQVLEVHANSGIDYEAPSVAPTVTTGAASSISQVGASLGGNITDTGGANATVRGFQYGLTETPTWTVNESGSFGTGAFSIGTGLLEPDTTYHYRAYATNPIDTSYGDWESFTTPELNAPGFLTTTRIFDTQMDLTWGDPGYSGDGFEIQRQVDEGSYQALITVAPAPNTYSDTTTLVNKRYRYRVRTYDGSKYSTWTESDYTYTTPAAPSGIAMSRGSIVLNWVDNATWEQGFEIQRLDGGSWVALATVAAGVITYTDTTAVLGDVYQYRVRAYRLTPIPLYSAWLTSGSFLYTNAGISIKVIDNQGTETYVNPSKVSARLSENAAVEITIEFDNADGLKTDIIRSEDTVEIESNYLG